MRLWPRKKVKPAPKGSFMNENGAVTCQCGEVIRIEIACVLPTVPTSRFIGMKPPQVLMHGIPCPKCDRSHSVKMEPNG